MLGRRVRLYATDVTILWRLFIVLPLAFASDNLNPDMTTPSALACSEPWQDLVYRHYNVVTPTARNCGTNESECDTSDSAGQRAHHLARMLFAAMSEVCVNGVTNPEGNLGPTSDSDTGDMVSDTPHHVSLEGRCGFDHEEMGVQPSSPPEYVWNGFDSGCLAVTGETSHPDLSLEEWASRKFLAILFLPEQLSKARQHLTEMVALAVRFDRALILPTVHGSRIGLPGLMPLCSYFDVRRLGRHVAWVTEKFHVSLMRRLGRPPSTFFVCLTSLEVPCMPQGYQWSRRFIGVLALTHGVVFSGNDSSSGAALEHIKGMTPKKSAKLEEKALFSLFEARRDMDLVVFVKRVTNRSLNATLMAKSATEIEFAPQLLERSDRLASQLSKPFVAVHLRFEHLAMRVLGLWVNGEHENETIAIVRMHMCSKGAVHMVRKVLRIKKYKASVPVFIASDLVYKVGNTSTANSGGRFNSDTIKSLNKEVVDAMKHATKRVYSQLNGARIDMLDPSLEAADSGVKAILDKLICSKATQFIVGSKSCGGLGSYEAGILNYRKMNRLKESRSVHRFTFG